MALAGPRPTLIAHACEPRSAAIERVLVALDELDSAGALLHIAAGLSRQTELTVEALHVRPAHEGALDRTAHWKDQIQSRARDAGIESPIVHVLEGRAAETITRYVSSRDLLVCGARARGAHGPLGSVASSVVRDAPCPVVVVRPTVPSEHLGGTKSS